jgi:hypothetical protein
MTTIHVPLPPRSSLDVPFVGRFLTKAAMDFINEHRPDLFKPGSAYSITRIIPDRLWLARLKGYFK